MVLRTKLWILLERVLLGAGLALMAVWAGMTSYRLLAAGLALREFDRAQAGAPDDGPPSAIWSGKEAVDFSQWSAARKAAYRKHLSPANPPLAVLRLVRADIRVPVFAGTDEGALSRGAGWIAGTAAPGQDGNIGIAGHRDGFFRKLKDVSRGDKIELATLRDRALYTVDDIEIVGPEKVSVLLARAVPTLTLVTCYPFYFVGNAPKRYIVHASLRERATDRK